MTQSHSLYLDYAAATPVDSRVLRAMRPYFSEKFGNPGSLHRAGAEALKALDEARARLARVTGTEFRDVVFTASATEANNLAIRGVISKWKLVNRKIDTQLPITNYQLLPKLVVSAGEHDSVLETARDMERAGEIELAVIPVDTCGVVDIKKLESALDERTILVSVMYVNNEVGTLQPISEIAAIVRNFRSSHTQMANSKWSDHSPFANGSLPLLHTDAAQAFLYYSCNVKELGVDLMTLSSQKIYGPKGAGALCINSKLETLNSKQTPNHKLQIPNVSDLGFRVSDLSRLVAPIVTGGGQEFGLRAGTENIPSIVGFAAAAEIAERERGKNTKHAAQVKNVFVAELKKGLSGVKENISASVPCAPHIVNIAFPKGISSEDLLVLFDREGIAASPGAACSARALALSHVLRAIGMPDERIRRSIRFSFGRGVTSGAAKKAARRVGKTCRYFLDKKS